MTAERILIATAALALGACGGAAPLLHPVHPLPRERVSMGAGVSTQLVTGDAANQIDAARRSMSDGAVSSAEDRERYAGGALAYGLLSPGLAPWLSARVGLDHSMEAGVTYTARAVRLDARYALASGHLAASAGLGASGVLARPGSGSSSAARADRDQRVPGLDLGGVSGFGCDLPLLFGYRSSGDALSAWLGVRGGFERLRGTAVLRVDLNPAQEEEARFEAQRWYALGVAGFGVTLHPVTVAFELDGGYQRGSGELAFGGDRTSGSLHGLSLSPALAVIFQLWQ